jgi:hypothetical protein
MEVGESTPFDAVIPFHPKDTAVLSYCVASLRRYVTGLRNIYVISKDDPEEDDIIWIPESTFPFTLSDVAAVIKSTNQREGWYLQQLLKFYAFRVITGVLPHVLIFDSDCVVCRPIRFISPEGRIYLDWNPKQEHLEYFRHAEAVMGDLFVLVDPEKSGITDHMMVYKPHLEELLQRMEARSPNNKAAWQILLEAVDSSQYNKSGMSEYEIYFNYVLTWFPEEYAFRQLERGAGTSFRAFTEGSAMSDIIAFHAWGVDKHKNEIEISRMGVRASGGTDSELPGSSCSSDLPAQK